MWRASPLRNSRRGNVVHNALHVPKAANREQRDHCVSIADKYQKVVDENLKLAKSYRDHADKAPE